VYIVELKHINTDTIAMFEVKHFNTDNIAI